MEINVNKKSKILLIKKKNVDNKKCTLLLKKKKIENKYSGNFLNTEIVQNIKNHKENENTKNDLFQKKILYNSPKNKSINLKVFFKLKNIGHKHGKSLNYNYNHSELQKSLQKYFSLTENDLIEKKKSKELIYNKINKDNFQKNKKVLKGKAYINNNTNIGTIRKINILNNKAPNKILLSFKQKSKELNFDNNKIKNSQIVSNNRIYLTKYKHIKNIININKDNYIKAESTKMDISINNNNFFRNKKKFFNHNPKSQSLNLLYNLDDYIGHNQYKDVVIPDNRTKIIKRISIEKEKEMKKIKQIFNYEENKNNIHYKVSKDENRLIKTPDDYYNKKAFDKLILSGEKKSKNFKTRNLLYNTAFKSYKNEFKYKIQNNLIILNQ